MKKLVIVESPTKVKSVERYLGKDYVVMASVGHIRDLPTPQELGPELRKSPYGKFSVDVENGFDPYYVVLENKKKTVKELKAALKDADELLLATDGDREGEAIAWHLVKVLEPKVPFRRMVFHEITKEAVQQAQQNLRPLDNNLVDAQETRRILDRLYGYEISPVLWKKVRPGLSAGRVQSPATRLVVDREKERIAFKSAEYWSVEAEFSGSISAPLTELGGKRIAVGRDFDNRGQLQNEALWLDENQAQQIAQALEECGLAKVIEVEDKPYRRRPPAPFVTSTLQQEAANKLGLSAKRTMRAAQQLYENGYITYMRTDSTRLSDQAVAAAREQAQQCYGKNSVPDKPREYKGKAQRIQEAHEAIRPAGEKFIQPKDLELGGDAARVYELIWRRTVASQMVDVQGKTVTAKLTADTQEAIFAISGTVITERGFLQAYKEEQEVSDKIPDLKKGQVVQIISAKPNSHSTAAPPRYTEATLVRALEELGMGRPSTYAAILGTIQDRGYVHLRNKSLVPSWLAFSVINLMEDAFAPLVDYNFTARLEDELDQIAAGAEQRAQWLKKFYFGDEDHPGLSEIIANSGEVDARRVNSIEMPNATLRVGRYGPYLQAGDKRCAVPPNIDPDQLTEEKVKQLFEEAENSDRELGINPDNGLPIMLKVGRFGPYVEEVSEDNPPRRSSLFKDMDPQEVDLELALKLLNIPRLLGVDPESGDEITAHNGRYGPYVKCGVETRALSSEGEILDITLEQAIVMLRSPKVTRQNQVMVDFGAEDPESKKPIYIKGGRFGPYITDGATNVTLGKRKPEEITLEEAVQLLAAKRAKPSGKGGRKPVKK